MIGLCEDAPDGMVHLIMEYCSGGTLVDFVRACAKVTASDSIVRQGASGSCSDSDSIDQLQSRLS